MIQSAVFTALPLPVCYGGQDRYETATAVLKANPPPGGFLYLATRENYPDALTGGALAATQGADIVLVLPGGPSAAELSLLQTWHGFRALALGGSTVVADSAWQVIQRQTR